MNTYRNPQWKRRDVVWTGLAVGGTTLGGCQFFSTDPTGSDDTPEGDDRPESMQAPMLAEQVEVGNLPPVAERLPDEPLTVQPVDRIGVYGGQWNTVVKGIANLVTVYMAVGYEQLVSWHPDFENEVIPNVARSFEVTEDGTVFTFQLRAGMRWSNGSPYTADDLLFAYDDIIQDDELGVAMPSFLAPGGEPGSLEKLDDHTVRFSFDRPHGLFLQRLAAPQGSVLTAWPRQYLEQFHQKYNPDVAELAEQGGYNNWVELFDAKANLEGKNTQWQNPDLPTVHPWHLVTGLNESSRVELERNPYYFKVDTDNRQLPYIDRVVFENVDSDEVIMLKANSGEIDMDIVNVNSLQMKPVLAQNRESGGFRFFDTAPTSMNYMIISLNHTHENSNLREIFRNKDFRIGLSHAINRDELISTIFQQQGEPWQAAPRPDSLYFDEQLATQYLEYDVDLAKECLDRAGYVDHDADGFRLGPDGNRIRFSVEVAIGADIELVDAVDLVTRYWRQVGVDADTESEDRSLFYDRKEANMHDANVWFDKMGLHDAVLDPRWYIPVSDEANYAILWSNWYHGTDPSERPPEATRRQMQLYDELQATDDEDRRHELFAEILTIAREEFYVIGTVLPSEGFGIVKDNFHNVREPMPDGWIYPTPGPSRPEQYFIDPQ